MCEGYAKNLRHAKLWAASVVNPILFYRNVKKMLSLSDAPEQDIKDFVKHWLKLLANNRLNDACALLDESNCYGIVWTPDMLLEAVHNTFSPDTRFYRLHPEGPIFTDLDALEEYPGQGEVIAFSDRSGYAFDQDIPLNGERSDLTAQFEFRRGANGFAVILHDLHVM